MRERWRSGFFFSKKIYIYIDWHRWICVYIYIFIHRYYAYAYNCMDAFFFVSASN